MLHLSSSAFNPNASIPAQYTCDGDELSPPLVWQGVPAGTASLALLVDDPDAPDPAAPKRIWVHWILYNLGPGQQQVAEGAGNAPPAGGARTGRNDGGTTGWQGPCPPIGRHRYFFRLFALDTVLPDLGTDVHRADFERAMDGHVLATAVLMGTYAHPGNG
jgi:Raf kinase inhibitor-like YbhB/YbcL family protein